MNVCPPSGAQPHGKATVVRVLHVVGAMNVGGAETMLMNLHRSLDRSRVQFDYLVYGDEEGAYDREIRELGGRVIRAGFGLLGRVGERQIRRAIRQHGPFGAVHAHVLHASALAVRAAHREGVTRRITHSHTTADIPGGTVRRLYNALTRRMIVRYSTHLVACGAEAGYYLFGDLAWTLVRNGVDLARFAPALPGRRADLRKGWGIRRETTLIGSVARMETVKNHHFLIDVAMKLRSQGADFCVFLVGDGSLRRELEERVSVEGLYEHVKFLGLRSDTAELIQAFDVLAVPSLYEGLPVVLVEAQASGLPVVVSSNVTPEADLGLGLVRFKEISSVDDWARALVQPAERASSSTEFNAHLRAAGADIGSSAEMLYQIYGVSDG